MEFSFQRSIEVTKAHIYIAHKVYANIIGESNFGEKFLAFCLTFFRITYNGYTPPPAPQPGTLQARGFHWRLQCSEGVQNDLQWIFKVLRYSAPSQAILPNDMSLPQSHFLPEKSPSVEYLTRGHHLLYSLSGRLHNITYNIHCIIGSIQDPTFKFKLDNSMSQCLGCIVDSISAPPPFL